MIRWLEDNHIPVDRVAGTSMGSIIGAMYATGMSPAEIQQFAEKIDWDEAFLAGPQYSDLAFRREQDRRRFQVNAAIGLKRGLSGPIDQSGRSDDLLLDRIALPDLESQASTISPFRFTASPPTC